MKGILASELRYHVIRPTLQDLGLWSLAAENLLLGTAAHESLLGHYLTQQGGPALGIYQIEPATHQDIWRHYLAYRAPLAEQVRALAQPISPQQTIPDRALITHLAYATAIARLLYARVSSKLPDADDVTGLAQYWKQYYNTALGKGSVEDFIQRYKEYIQ